MELSSGEIGQLLQSITSSSNQNTDIVVRYLMNKHQRQVESYVNKGLAVTAEHESTLKLLCEILPYFSNDIFQENIITWLQGATFKSRNSSVQYQFLGIALQHCALNEDYNKSKLVVVLPNIIEKCLLTEKGTIHESNAIFCLQNCLQYYPSICSPLIGKVKKFLLEYLDNENYNLFNIPKAAACFHYMQQCASANNNTSKYTYHVNNWSDAFNRLCATIKNVHDCISENGYDIGKNDEGFLLCQLPSDVGVIQSLQIAEQRLSTLCTFLKVMIEKSYPVPKVIKPQVLISVLESSMFPNIVEKDSIGVQFIKSLFLRHQIQVYNLFRYFIALTKTALIPFCNRIMKLFVDKLHETRSADYKNNNEYKAALYKVITFFVRTMKNNVCSQFHQKLLAAIIDDITPIVDCVLLTIPGNPKSLSSKKRKRMTETKTIDSCERRQKKYNDFSTHLKAKICSAALECLSECFKNISFDITQRVVKDALTNVYRTLCTTATSLQSGTRVVPYVTENCHYKLIETLVAAIEQPCPPPLQVLMSILVTGQKSNLHQMSHLCNTALSIVEKICQPVQPWLFHATTTCLQESGNESIEIPTIDDDVSMAVAENIVHNESNINNTTALQESVRRSLEYVNEDGPTKNIHLSGNSMREDCLSQVQLENDHVLKQVDVLRHDNMQVVGSVCMDDTDEEIDVERRCSTLVDRDRLYRPGPIERSMVIDVLNTPDVQTPDSHEDLCRTEERQPSDLNRRTTEDDNEYLNFMISSFSDVSDNP